MFRRLACMTAFDPQDLLASWMCKSWYFCLFEMHHEENCGILLSAVMPILYADGFMNASLPRNTSR